MRLRGGGMETGDIGIPPLRGRPARARRRSGAALAIAAALFVLAFAEPAAAQNNGFRTGGVGGRTFAPGAGTAARFGHVPAGTGWSPSKPAGGGKGSSHRFGRSGANIIHSGRTFRDNHSSYGSNDGIVSTVQPQPSRSSKIPTGLGKPPRHHDNGSNFGGTPPGTGSNGPNFPTGGAIVRFGTGIGAPSGARTPAGSFTTGSIITGSISTGGTPSQGAGPPGGPGAGRAGRQFPPLRRANTPPAGEQRFVPNEILIEVSSGASQRLLDRIARRLRLVRVNSIDMQLLGSSLQRWQITGGRSVASVIRALARYRILASIQPNHLYATGEEAQPSERRQERAPAPDQPAAQAQPQQPQAGTGSEPPPTGAPASQPQAAEGEAGQYALAKMRLPEAHRLATGENVLVAVIDSGIDASHPDLAGVIADKFDAVGGDDKPHKHGTAIAGAIVSHGKLTGAAPAAKLLAIRAFEPKGAGAEGTTFNIVRGIEWAFARGARVVNMSFTGPPDPLLRRVFSSARWRGLVLVAAAGNAGPKSPPLFPAMDANVIAVTATDADNKLFPQANRGKYIAVAAPGVDVLLPAPQASYQLITGTSVAAAQVSGVVALLVQRRNTITPATVTRILLDTARDLGPKGRDEEFGAGLTDAYGAVLYLEPRSAQQPHSAAPAH